MAKVAIIVLSYNSLDETTKPCLESIYACKTKIDFETVVVDNLSVDGTRDYLESIQNKYANLCLIFNDHNYGYAKGNNIGIRSIQADYYVLLNSDTIVTDYWLDKFVNFLEHHPEVGMVGPVSNSVGCGQKIFCQGVTQEEILSEGEQWCNLCEGDIFFTDMLGFFCVCIRKEVFDAIGLLDEQFGIGMFEDDDFCLRVQKKGYKMACLEDVFIYHKGSVSFNKFNQDFYLKLFLENAKKFENKHQKQWHTHYQPSSITLLINTYLRENNYDSDKLQKKIVNRLQIIDNMETFGYIDILKQSEVIKEKENQIINLNQQINQIYSSKLWKIATRLKRIAYKTKTIYLLKALMVLYRFGFKELCKRVVKKVVKFLKKISFIAKILKLFSVWATKATKNKGNKLCFNNPTEKVSIVLPVYNQANYLDESIKSVLTQTYQNIELIVVNDGSTDNVEDILKKYIDDPRVKLLTQDNQKLPAALNNGFEYATGDFYTWTSADNIMLPNQIEILVKYLKKNPTKAMVYSDYLVINDQGEPLNDPNFRRQNQDQNDINIMRLPNKVTIDNFHVSGDNFIGASFMYRKDVARIIGKYSSDTFGGEDYDYWLRIHNLFDIGHVDKVLYKYRVHANTLNSKAHELNLFQNIQILLERDKKRREFLIQKFCFRQYETKLNFDSKRSDHIINIINYSLKDSPDIQEIIANEKQLSVCYINELDAYVDVNFLQKCDIIITHNKDLFNRYQDLFKYKLLLINSINKYSVNLSKILKNRLFDKLYLQKENNQHPRIYVNRKLNVVLQVESMDKGGLEKVVYNLIKNIDKEKFNIFLFIVGNELGYFGSQLKQEGIHVFLLNHDEECLNRLIIEKNIDIVNLHYSLFGVEIYKKNFVECIYTIHNNYTWFEESDCEYRRQIYEKIDSFIAVSNQVKNYFSNKFNINYNNIKTIPNGFDETDFSNIMSASREEFGFSNDDFIFINVASFAGIKLHGLMINALKELVSKFPNIKLIFVGNVDKTQEDYYNYIKSIITEERLASNIKIIDYVPKEKIGALLKLANCFMLPSLSEGWSNAIMEAMYFELPLILSDVGSARDVIYNEDIGIIIPNPYKKIEKLSVQEMLKLTFAKKFDNEKFLVEAMENIYCNHEIWQEKAKNGKLKVKQHFLMNNMISAYEDAYIEQYFITQKKGKDDKKHLSNILRSNFERNIIIFPPLVDWNIPLFQRPQHIASNLANQGFLYFFNSARAGFDKVNGFIEIKTGCYLTNCYDLLKELPKRKTFHLYSTDLYITKEFVDDIIQKGNLIVYEYIDEISAEISGRPIPESKLISHQVLLEDERCLVVISADKLYQDVLKHRSNNIVFVTNGVDYNHFSHVGDDVPCELTELISKGKPIIGYFGALASWFDFELIIKLAKERPNYEILLIGILYDDTIKKYEINKYNNIHIQGPYNYQQLPSYACWFDVAMIPFLINEITESTSPIKLFEYMALGKPIVTTDMRECRKYHSVLIGTNHEDFIEKIDHALLLKNNSDYLQILKKEALDNTWEAKAALISKAINSNLND